MDNMAASHVYTCHASVMSSGLIVVHHHPSRCLGPLHLASWCICLHALLLETCIDFVIMYGLSCNLGMCCDVNIVKETKFNIIIYAYAYFNMSSMQLMNTIMHDSHMMIFR